MAQPNLGKQLRTLRGERGHSIAEVAEGTGISASFLSLVENGRSDIAIGRLIRLTEFYNVGLATLFPEKPATDVEVVRRDDYLHLPSDAEGLDLMLLAPDANRRMTPFLAVYEVGGGMSEPKPDEGEAFVYVLDGQIGIALDDGRDILLDAGDTVYIRYGGRRTYRNAGTVTARLLGVITRPNGS